MDPESDDGELYSVSPASARSIQSPYPSLAPLSHISLFLQFTDTNLSRDVFSERRPPNTSPGMLAASSSDRRLQLTAGRVPVHEGNHGLLQEVCVLGHDQV